MKNEINLGNVTKVQIHRCSSKVSIAYKNLKDYDEGNYKINMDRINEFKDSMKHGKTNI